jgi:hypothetical protein
MLTSAILYTEADVLANARSPGGGGAGLGRDRLRADSSMLLEGGRPGAGPAGDEGGRRQVTRGRAKERWCAGIRSARDLRPAVRSLVARARSGGARRG